LWLGDDSRERLGGWFGSSALLSLSHNVGRLIDRAEYKSLRHVDDDFLIEKPSFPNTWKVRESGSIFE